MKGTTERASEEKIVKGSKYSMADDNCSVESFEIYRITE